MSIASELTRIETAKSNLKTSIEGKGVTVPSTATLDAYPTYVDSIQQGGGSSWAEIDTQPSTTLDRMATYITSVDIPTNVTAIGSYAFQYCSGLTSVTIPSGVTSIGNYAFNGCSNLPSINIPSGVTSIGQSAFEGCSNIPSINIPSGVTSIGISAFYGCQSLKSITIPSGVTSIAITTFRSCTSLTAVTIPSNSNLTSIGNNAFQLCWRLPSITIPSGVTSIGSNAFNRCESLTSINIPSGVTSIGQSAFNGCSVLTSVTINAVTPPTLGASAFYNTNDCPIYVPEGSVDAYKTATNWSTYASRIQAIPQPATWELVTNLKNGATKIKADYSLIPSEYVYTNNAYSLTSDGVNAAVYYADSAFIEGMSEDYGVDFSDYEGEVILVDGGSDSSTITYMLTLEDGVEYDLVSVLGSSVDIQTMASLDGYYLYAK